MTAGGENGIGAAFARIEALGARIRSLLPPRAPLPGGGAPSPAQAAPASFRDALAAATGGEGADVPEELAPKIREAAARHRIPQGVLEAMVRTESNFDPRAVSPRGAAGLLQLMPDTAREMGVVDRFDPDASLDGGARYLSEMRKRFHTLPLSLAAYNAGPTAVERFRAIPPYDETRRYVERILGGISDGTRANFEAEGED